MALARLQSRVWYLKTGFGYPNVNMAQKIRSLGYFSQALITGIKAEVDVVGCK